MKAFLCIVVLALSYLASADVSSYALPLSNGNLALNTTVYLSDSCATVNGKLYYVDVANKTEIVQVWNSATQEVEANLTLATVLAQQAVLLTNVNSTVSLQCLGNTVYVSFAYSNSTNTGIEQFLLNGTAYALNHTSNDTSLDLEASLAQRCQTTDGRLHYVDNGNGSTNSTLRVWDSTNQTAGVSISLENVGLQLLDFVTDLNIPKVAPAFRCIGEDVYYTLAWENSTNSGIELWLIESAANATNVSLPLSNDALAQTSTTYLAYSCSTVNGKFYYIDLDTDGKTSLLREWDSNNQQLGAVSISLADSTKQIQTFTQTLGVSTLTEAIRCVGNDVYHTVAYTNATNTGLEVFQIKKAASVGILSLSFAGFFLALIALLL